MPSTALFREYQFIYRPMRVAYFAKKRAEGKRYNVTVFHAAKKLAKALERIKAAPLSGEDTEGITHDFKLYENSMGIVWVLWQS